MKIFLVIFSFYILILSCLPCGDAKDCDVVHNGKETFSQPQHSHHQQDTESCSPFCACVCCGINIDLRPHNLTFITEKQLPFYIQRADFAHVNDFNSSNFYGNIWQPPQV